MQSWGTCQEFAAAGIKYPSLLLLLDGERQSLDQLQKQVRALQEKQ